MVILLLVFPYRLLKVSPRRCGHDSFLKFYPISMQLPFRETQSPKITWRYVSCPILSTHATFIFLALILSSRCAQSQAFCEPCALRIFSAAAAHLRRAAGDVPLSVSIAFDGERTDHNPISDTIHSLPTVSSQLISQSEPRSPSKSLVEVAESDDTNVNDIHDPLMTVTPHTAVQSTPRTTRSRAQRLRNSPDAGDDSEAASVTPRRQKRTRR